MDGIPKEMRAWKDETREKIRRGLASELEAAARVAPRGFITAERIRAASGADANKCSAAYKLWRAGKLTVSESWADPEPEPAAGPASSAESLRAGLMESIRRAVTDGDREAIAQELAALVAGDVIAPDAASQVKGALAEARQSAEAKRTNEPPPEDPRRLLLAGSSAMDAARALDRFVDLERRDRVLAFIAAEVEADIVQNPNEDEGGQ